MNGLYALANALKFDMSFAKKDGGAEVNVADKKRKRKTSVDEKVDGDVDADTTGVKKVKHPPVMNGSEVEKMEEVKPLDNSPKRRGRKKKREDVVVRMKNADEEEMGEISDFLYLRPTAVLLSMYGA